MSRSRTRFPIRWVFPFLLVFCLVWAPAIMAEDGMVDLSKSVNEVYIPPGSAYNFLGLLFSELDINGGIEFSDLFRGAEKRAKMKDRKEGDFTDVWHSKPGDPDYFLEYEGERLSRKQVLTQYCEANDILQWTVRDDVVNVSCKDMPKGRNNPLNWTIKEVVLKEGWCLAECFKHLVSCVGERLGKRGIKMFVPHGVDKLGGQPVLDDSADAAMGICLSRTKKYSNKTMRQILNDLVRPFHNVVWISKLGEKKEGKNSSYGLYVGSWVQNARRSDLLTSISDLESSLHYKYRTRRLPPPLKQLKIHIYKLYRDDRASVMKALKKEIEKTKEEEFREELEAIIEGLKENDFNSYARNVIGTSW